MNVKIIRAYYDSTRNNEFIKADTEFPVSDERGKVLIDAGVAKEIKEVEKVVNKKKNSK